MPPIENMTSVPQQMLQDSAKNGYTSFLVSVPSQGSRAGRDGSTRRGCRSDVRAGLFDR